LYLREILDREDGAPPPVDLAVERRNGELVRRLIQDGTVRTVHDLSDGGLAAAAAEMALASNMGLELTLAGEAPTHGQLFGEDQARYLLALADPARVLEAARAAGVPAAVVGKAGGESVAVAGLFDLPLARLRQAHEGWMPAYMG
jgi:phosphoribosylformylglycinamidine synthase